MYPHHYELIEFLHLLGHPNYSDGICFGISSMSVTHILNGPDSIEQANLRLQKIKSCLDAYKVMQREYKKDGETCHRLDWFLDITVSPEEKIDILAYCDGLALYFKPKKYPQCFPDNIYLEQNFLLSHGIVQSIQTEKKGGVTLIEITYFYCNKINIKSYLEALDFSLKKFEITSSFSLQLESKNHSICLGYSKKKNMWCYFNINDESMLYHYTSSFGDIEKFILGEFKEIQDDIGLVVSTKMYCFSIHRENIIKFKELWSAKLSDAGLFEITKENIKPDALGMPWIYALALRNDLNTLSCLIAKGINVNVIHSNGLTALDVACYRGFKEFALILLNAGADINIPSKFLTPLMIAISHQQQEIAELLLEKNIDVFIKGKNGKDALNYAVYYKNTNISESILVRMNSAERLLDNTVLGLFLKNQESQKKYVISTAAEKFFYSILENHPVSHENKKCILQLYIILRENEYRKMGSEYNSRVSQFFNLTGSNSRAKLNAAKALLNEESHLEKRQALQSGRLGKIAAFFLTHTGTALALEHR